MEGMILPGELAWYGTGRFYAAAEGGSLLHAGYFLYLQGIDGRYIDPHGYASPAAILG